MGVTLIMLIRSAAVALWELAKLLLVGGVDYCRLRYEFYTVMVLFRISLIAL